MKLALGTAQLGLDYGISNRSGKTSARDAAAIVSTARSAGITTIDTAVSYGDAESRLGEVGAQGFDIVSKLPAVPDQVVDVEEWITTLVTDSLRKLRLNRLYGLLLHRPEQLSGPRGLEIVAALETLRASGLVQKTGVSVHAPSDLDAMPRHLRPGLVQAPFNLFDNRLVSSGWLSRLKEGDTEVHVRSIFLQGVLLFTANERPDKFARWSAHFREYDNWMAMHGRSALDVCVSHALSVQGIDKVVVGVENAAQLQAIVDAASTSPPPGADRLVTTDVDLLDPLVWMRR